MRYPLYSLQVMQQACCNLKMITEEKDYEIIRLDRQLKNVRKTTVQASVFKEKLIRMLKIINREKEKKSRSSRVLSVRD